MKKSFIFYLLIGIISLSNLILAQTQSLGVVGKLYTKAEADQLYGPVKQSISINTSTLTNLAAKTPDYILFNVINNSLYVLNSSRAVLQGPATAVSSSQVFKLFSVSMVKQLIQQGQSTTTSIELRANVLTVTNGDYTLEDALSCPPWCI